MRAITSVKCIHAEDCQVDWCWHIEAHPLNGGLCDTECNNGDEPRESHCEPVGLRKESAT